MENLCAMFFPQSMQLSTSRPIFVAKRTGKTSGASLAITPRDAAIERVFWIAGDIQRPKRATLQSGTLSNFLMVKH